MSHYTNVRNRAASCETAPPFAPFTGVRLWYDDEQYFFAGDETGRVLEADNPWATQAMAESVLASVSGYSYQPFEAGSAILDPAAELGDGVNVGGVYGPLASITTRFDAMCAADISAPADEEIDHEYPYLSPAEREYKRNKARTYSLISKTSEEIRLEVHNLQENTELSLEEMEKTFGEDLEDLEKAFGKDLDDLAGNITETLKQYSTIKQTAQDIELAVNESKTYTDTKTGAVAAELKNYSTITQTAKDITAAVNESKTYTDTKTGAVSAELKNYSTVTQTANSITSAVTESKTYTDTKTGEITKTLENYSTIQQTANSISMAVNGLINETQANSLISQAMDKIELSVSSANGSTSLKLTSNGVEIDSDTVEMSVNAMKINGLIQANQLNLSGAITWDDLAPETQNEIEAQHTSLPSYIKRTYIDATTVKSPTIEGNDVIARTAFKVTPVGTDGDGDEVEVPCGSMGLAFGETLDENGDPVTTYGVALASASTSVDANGAITVASNGYYVIVTNEGVRLQAGDTRLYVTDNGAFYNGVELGVGTGGVAVFG